MKTTVHAFLLAAGAAMVLQLAGCNDRLALESSGQGDEGDHTILLYVLSDPATHIEQAKYYKQATEKDADWKGLFIVHKADYSSLYWGRYKTLQAAQVNLEKAKGYRTPVGVPIFAKAIVVP
ncbi:MAG: hypothetical protein KAU28_02295, partial [Phycisphaerae bacterium]|nr:hypothetical protein [Phycisphaerae bacterium]